MHIQIIIDMLGNYGWDVMRLTYNRYLLVNRDIPEKYNLRLSKNQMEQFLERCIEMDIIIKEDE